MPRYNYVWTFWREARYYSNLASDAEAFSLILLGLFLHVTLPCANTHSHTSKQVPFHKQPLYLSKEFFLLLLSLKVVVVLYT